MQSTTNFQIHPFDVYRGFTRRVSEMFPTNDNDTKLNQENMQEIIQKETRNYPKGDKEYDTRMDTRRRRRRPEEKGSQEHMERKHGNTTTTRF